MGNKFLDILISLGKVLSWLLISPKKFVVATMETLVGLKKKTSQVITVLSFFLPALFGLSLYNWAGQTAFLTISDRILALRWQVLIYIGLATLVALSYSIALPGPLLLHKIRKHHPELKKNFRTFHRFWVFRRNLLFLPLNFVFWLSSANLDQDVWSVYSLGLFLEITIWVAQIWAVIFFWAAIGSIKVDFHAVGVEEDSPIKPSQKISKTIAFSSIFLTFYMGLMIGLSFWLGAPAMPLGYKIAIILLHGQ